MGLELHDSQSNGDIILGELFQVSLILPSCLGEKKIYYRSHLGFFFLVMQQL